MFVFQQTRSAKQVEKKEDQLTRKYYEDQTAWIASKNNAQLVRMGERQSLGNVLSGQAPVIICQGWFEKAKEQGILNDFKKELTYLLAKNKSKYKITGMHATALVKVDPHIWLGDSYGYANAETVKNSIQGKGKFDQMTYFSLELTEIKKTVPTKQK